MFLLTPLHVSYSRLNCPVQAVIFIVLSLLSIFMHRPIHGIFVFQSVLYYMPVYLLGIFCAVNKEMVYRVFFGKEYILLLAIAVFSACQAWAGVWGNYHKSPLEYGGLDFMYLQKVAMAVFFMVWLSRFEGFNNKVINTLASTSFAIFFIHPYLMFVLGALKSRILLGSSGGAGAFIMIFCLLVVTSVVIAAIARKVLGNKSKYLIGY